MAQTVRAFAQHAEGWVFESQPRQNQVVYTGSNSSTVKRSAIGVSVTCPQRMAISAEIGQSLQFFTEKGDVSEYFKNSRMGRKIPNKQKYWHVGPLVSWYEVQSL